MKGRNIHEAFSLAHEVVTDIDKKVFGGNIMLNVDMSKAYDRLEWPFVYAALQK